MSKDSLEHISCLMDGELSHETSLFIARRMGTDERLGQTWERYHLIRECLRSPGGKWAVTGMTLGHYTIQPDRYEQASSPGLVQRWLRPAASFAIAASVAVVAIFTAMPGPVPEAGNQVPVAQPFTSPNPLSALPASQPASFNAQSSGNQRLNTYLLRHNQVAVSAGRQGFVSFVPIVTASTVQVMDPVDATEEETAAASEAPPQPQP